MSQKKQNDGQIPFQLLANVASQLRGALGNIGSAVERIAPEEAREGNRALDENAAMLYQSYHRALRLVNNLSEAAEFGQEALFQPKDGDIVRLCREICLRVQSLAALQGLALSFVCEEEEYVMSMYADGVERLLLNLLSNAMKFTPAGGSITVELCVDEDDEQVRLTVSDTGCGIKAELLPTVFDRFCHVERMDPIPHGLGLGLPICRHIARRHGGDITVVSTEHVGTSVTVTLSDGRSGTLQLRDIPFDYAGGYDHVLVELSDALDAGAFTAENMG